MSDIINRDWSVRITTGEPDDRIDALDDLRAAVRAKEVRCHDELLAILRQRAGFGEDAERDQRVREAIFHTKRALAVSRGRARGLRGPLPDDVMTLGDRELMWSSIVFVWDAVSIYDGPEILDAGLALATERQRHFFAIWWTISEVSNGGFHQYFKNATGIVAEVALTGLRALGAQDAAAALNGACAPFRGGRLVDRAHRLEVLDTLDREAFDVEDRAFFAAYPSVVRSVAAYVRGNAGEFFE